MGEGPFYHYFWPGWPNIIGGPKLYDTAAVDAAFLVLLLLMLLHKSRILVLELIEASHVWLF